jgi:hypothetical protein
VQNVAKKTSCCCQMGKVFLTCVANARDDSVCLKPKQKNTSPSFFGSSFFPACLNLSRACLAKSSRESSRFSGMAIGNCRFFSELSAHQRRMVSRSPPPYDSSGRHVIPLPSYCERKRVFQLDSVVFEFSLCLSRACLGNFPVLSVKQRKKDVVFLLTMHMVS